MSDPADPFVQMNTEVWYDGEMRPAWQIMPTHPKWTDPFWVMRLQKVAAAAEERSRQRTEEKRHDDHDQETSEVDSAAL